MFQRIPLLTKFNVCCKNVMTDGRDQASECYK